MLVNLVIYAFHKKNLSKELLTLAKLQKADDLGKSDYDTNRILNEIFSDVNYSSGNSQLKDVFIEAGDFFPKEISSQNSFKPNITDQEKFQANLYEGEGMQNLGQEDVLKNYPISETETEKYEVANSSLSGFMNSDSNTSTNTITNTSTKPVEVFTFDSLNSVINTTIAQSCESNLDNNGVSHIFKLFEKQKIYDPEMVDYLLNVSHVQFMKYLSY